MLLFCCVLFIKTIVHSFSTDDKNKTKKLSFSALPVLTVDNL